MESGDQNSVGGRVSKFGLACPGFCFSKCSWGNGDF